MHKLLLYVTLVTCVTVMTHAQPQAFTGHPGDVVAISGTVKAFGKSWDGLVGIDLNVKPGVYPISIVANDGSPSRSTSLTVLAKAFTVRRLRVAPSFVNPPDTEVPRILEEAKRTEAIFKQHTARKWTGAFQLPVDGQPTSNFGTRSFYNGQARSPHTGVDFLSPTGTPIHAANSGTVALAEPLYFTGNTVIVDYGDGLFALFAHMSEIHVHAGDAVTPDTILGLVGQTGRVTGPHLHWAVRLQGARVDPLTLVAATHH